MTDKPFATTPPLLRAEIEAAVRRAMAGQRDPEAMRRACEHMDQMREDIRRQHGVQDIGVELIRDLRGDPRES